MQDKLIQWYDQNKRDFPWRQNQDPYYIWISEIMLQQTTTEAVIPYFKSFIEAFPTINDLAKASEEEVYKLWEGLGYYRRAKYLHQSAQVIVERYEGLFPRDYQDIIALKGIGAYTAGAISSIAFHQSTPAVDGNVLRIMARYYLIKDNIALAKTQKQITHIVQGLLEGYDASRFNQGLMDLGAMICRPKNPQCERCPINDNCLAFLHHQQNVLPILIKNIKHQQLHYICGVITYQDQFMMIKNTTGLLENLYGFIQYDRESPYSFIEAFEAEYHQTLDIIADIGEVKHVFTHRQWHLHIYHFQLKEKNEQLYTLSQLQALPISTAHLKVLKAFLKNGQ